jgi:hypothetical protein
LSEYVNIWEQWFPGGNWLVRGSDIECNGAHEDGRQWIATIAQVLSLSRQLPSGV